ncbi:hypothetical protein [Halotalea alkalilenta]|uniref:hypothetical protein n=1 Tax=Halotalea alkalilenta TaxID=376489 RepID=UPI000488EF25|nr:hypothetical protein [Halotalea alkalilenta]
MRRRARLRLCAWCAVAGVLALSLGASLAGWLSLQRERWESRVEELALERIELTATLAELTAIERQRAMLAQRHRSLEQWLAVRDGWVELWAALSWLGTEGLRLERIERRGRLLRLEAQGTLVAANLALARLGGLPQVASARLIEHRPGAEGGWCRLELELPGLVGEPVEEVPSTQEVVG